MASSFGSEFRFTLMTDDPELAEAADSAGVDRIGLDLETIGKRERQGHLSHLRISGHSLDQLSTLCARLHRATPFVRCNPIHPGSLKEIDAAIAAGARSLMLPYFSSAPEAATFSAFVRGRAEVSLLVETPAAAEAIDDLVRIADVSEICVGLNDMQHALGNSSPFDFVTSPLMERLARTTVDAGLRFGFGGLADPTHAALPVPPPLVYAQYPRLGATCAFVARQFAPGGLRSADLEGGIARARAELDRCAAEFVRREA